MDIAILGAGAVGSTLGNAFVKAGHKVFWGVRDPSKEEYQKLVRSMRGKASIGTAAQAAASAAVVVLAVPWGRAEQAVHNAGDLTGKVIIDVTNAMKEDMTGSEVDCNTSCGETVARWAPGARVCKAFNHIGYNVMARPKYAGGTSIGFVAGDDAEAKKTVLRLVKDIGFDPVDAGPLWISRYMESLALLWVNLGAKAGLGWDFAFGLLRRGRKTRS